MLSWLKGKNKNVPKDENINDENIEIAEIIDDLPDQMNINEDLPDVLILDDSSAIELEDDKLIQELEALNVLEEEKENLPDKNNLKVSKDEEESVSKKGFWGRFKKRFGTKEEEVKVDSQKILSQEEAEFSADNIALEVAVDELKDDDETLPQEISISKISKDIESPTVDKVAVESIALEAAGDELKNDDETLPQEISISKISKDIASTAVDKMAVESIALEAAVDELKDDDESLPQEISISKISKDIESPAADKMAVESIALEAAVDELKDDDETLPQEITFEPQKTIVAEKASQKIGFWQRLKERLTATRDHLTGRLELLLANVREIDDDLLDELEEILITSDLGINTSTALLKEVRGKVAKKELKSPQALKEALQTLILGMLELPKFVSPEVFPLVIMVVGINGVGKTTTIAKLAKKYQDSGKKVLLAAGDTFRAAAVEQLTIWSKRLGTDIVSQATGADPSAVVYDALMAAKARKIDVVLIDTAGRLHTKVNLMDELKKMKRVADKALLGAPHETMLVLDANTGQNAVSQASLFNKAVGVDYLALTKLDGSSKGGVIISICNDLKIPVRYIGVGEQFEDLRDFEADEFTKALFE